MSAAEIRRGRPHVRPWPGQSSKPIQAARIAMLYLVSRKFWQTLVAIGGIAILVWWVMDHTPVGKFAHVDGVILVARNGTLLVHLAASLLASVIGIAIWSPFGETERVSPFGETERVSPVVLPVMRAVHLLSMLALGCLAMGLVVASWGDVVPGVALVPLFVRNTLYHTGGVLIAGLFLDVRLAWLLPVMLGGVTITGLLQNMARMRAPEDLWRGDAWNILALDLAQIYATAICLIVGIGAISVYIRVGVRDSVDIS